MPIFAAIGVALGAAAGSFTAVAVGVIATATVGAAIGGITAAVTGGDIGQGMLFGAIGGVATAGIASGIGAAIAPTATAGGTFGIGTSAAPVAATSGYGHGLVAPATNSGGLFGLGNIFGTGGTTTATGITGKDLIMNTALGKGLDFLSGAFAPQPEMPWGQTKEGTLAGWDHEKSMAKLNASLMGGGGSSSAPLPWQSTEEGVRYTMGEQYRQLEAQEAGATHRLEKQYTMQGELDQEAFDREKAKFGEAAEAREGITYEGASDETKQQLIEQQAMQRAEEDQALQGFDISEPVVMQA